MFCTFILALLCLNGIDSQLWVPKQKTMKQSDQLLQYTDTPWVHIKLSEQLESVFYSDEIAEANGSELGIGSQSEDTS